MPQLLGLLVFGLVSTFALWLILREQYCEGCMAEGDVSHCGDCGDKFCGSCLEHDRTCLWCHVEER